LTGRFAAHTTDVRLRPHKHSRIPSAANFGPSSKPDKGLLRTLLREGKTPGHRKRCNQRGGDRLHCVVPLSADQLLTLNHNHMK
jgi:hypothetical protein